MHFLAGLAALASADVSVGAEVSGIATQRPRELAGTLNSLSPLAVLGRGYAVCWDESRTSIIRSASATSAGEAVRVTLADGELACRVEETIPAPATGAAETK